MVIGYPLLDIRFGTLTIGAKPNKKKLTENPLLFGIIY